MDSLAEFLKQRRSQPTAAEDLHQRIGRFTAAVEKLMCRIHEVLRPYPELALDDWNTLLKEEEVRYNARALSIRFLELQITVEPKGMDPIGARGRVEMSCGVKLVLADWHGGDDWSYRWSIPSGDGRSQPLTDDAIKEIVQGLLA